MNLGLLAPAIVGGIVGLLVLCVALWVARNRPVLQLPAHETTEEDQRRLPFDERDREAEPEMRPQFQKQFEKH
jgi:hypothetical protein